MRATKARAIRKWVTATLATLPKHAKVSFKCAYRRAKEAYNRGEICL